MTTEEFQTGAKDAEPDITNPENEITDTPAAATDVNNTPKEAEAVEVEATDTAEVKGRGKKKRGIRKVTVALNIIFCSIIILCALFLVFINTFQLCLVDGESMEYTLDDGDFLLMQKWGYDIHRGDIITVYKTAEEKKRGGIPIIKRVIAVKGDRLAFMNKDGNVVLFRDTGDGFEELDEKYIKDGVMSLEIFDELNMFAEKKYFISPQCDITEIDRKYIIEVSQLFVMGDNRNNSLDSRHYGEMSYQNVNSKMLVRLKHGSFAEKLLKTIYHA